MATETLGLKYVCLKHERLQEAGERSAALYVGKAIEQWQPNMIPPPVIIQGDCLGFHFSERVVTDAFPGCVSRSRHALHAAASAHWSLDLLRALCPTYECSVWRCIWSCLSVCPEVCTSVLSYWCPCFVNFLSRFSSIVSPTQVHQQTAGLKGIKILKYSRGFSALFQKLSITFP